MYAIHKWPVSTAVLMPKGTRLLHVDAQNGALCVWGITDPSQPSTVRRLGVYGTGHRLPSGDPGKYVGTVLTQGGALVLHVFDEGES